MTRGTANAHAILVDADVREIRALHLSGEWAMSELAAKFGVRKATIQSVLTGDNWGWLLAEGELAALRKMREDRRIHRT